MNTRTKPKFVNKHAKPSVSWVNRLDEYKNLAIITGFLSYIFGFVLWSLYLWDIDAGYVYLYDFNLILSGLLPSIFFISWFYVEKNHSKIFIKNKFFFEKNIKLLTFLILFILNPVLIFLTLSPKTQNQYPLAISIIFFIVGFFIIYLHIALRLKSEGKLKIGILWVYLVLVLVSSRFFILIPQEFGGAQPKWVNLDINTQEFSNETLDYLYLNRETNISSTRPLMLLYSNSDFILIKKSLTDKAILIKTRYVNSIKSVSNQELDSYNLRIEKENLKATCLLMHTPAGLSCDQFVYPPLKKPTT